MIAFFDDAGFVLGGYGLTFAMVAAFVWRLITSGRRLGKQVPDDQKYWT
jgi:hypothetical protein